jgi:hypothetical protein
VKYLECLKGAGLVGNWASCIPDNMAISLQRWSTCPDSSYIMDMMCLRKNQYRGLFASLLIAVFFSSQAFSCCLVNQRLGQFIMSSWTKHAGVSATHSCCPSKQASNQRNAPDNTASKNGCCIQDANQKLPQMASEHLPVPDMTGLVLALLPMISLDAQSLPTPPSLQSRSSPPVYLTNLRLLI